VKSLWLLLHIAGVVIWVGGMTFALTCLAPAAAELLEAPARLRLLRRVFDRFLRWAAAAIVATLASGGAMLGQAVGQSMPRGAWIAMALIGVAMTLVYLVIRFAHYPALCAAVDGEDWKIAGGRMAKIRRLVLVNVALGWITIAVATLGRWFV
jgi:uncharacterized membrane protein